MTLEPRRQFGLILAGAAALAVLLSALFLPWHDIISGDEQIAPERMPQTRQSVAEAAASFDQANTRYQDYIDTHDLGALHDRILAVLGSPGEASDAGTLRDLTAQVQDYATVLRSYARASDIYLE